MNKTIYGPILFCFLLLAGCGGGGGSSNMVQTLPPQAATVASVSPTSVLAGTPGSTIQVTGTNFVSSSIVTFNGANLTTTNGSGTTLSAIIPASSLMGSQTAQIGVANPGAAASGTVPFIVNSPTPVLTSVLPAAVAAANAGVVTLTGTGFESNSAVQLNGGAVSSTFVNTTTLTVNFKASDLPQAGSGQLSVVNPPPQGSASSAIALQITQPVPLVQAISPASILAASGAVPVTLTGSNFLPTAAVTANGSALAISAQSATSITFMLPAILTAQTGSVSLIVTNPGLNPESSGVENLPVVAVPTLYDLSPSGAAVGTADQTLSVYGANFSPASVVEWNGTPLITTYQSSNLLAATLPAVDIARFTSASIDVTTPVGYPATPGFATSTTLPFSTYLALPNNDIAYNPADGLIYASVPGSAPGNLGNTIVGFDPVTGNLLKTIPVGSEPGHIAISSDGTQLFAGLNGAASVRQVNLVTAAAGIQFNLGAPVWQGAATTVEGLAALPGEPDSVAVFDNNATVTIYDAGVPRASNSSRLVNEGYVNESTGSLSFGPTASTLYVSSYLAGVIEQSIDSSGVSGAQFLSSTIEGGYQIQYDNGRLYLSNGTVLDASSASLLGTFSAAANQTASGPMVSDSTLGLAFVADSNVLSTPQLLAFNETTFNPAGSIPMSQGGFHKMVRWGQNGLAVSIPGQIYVVQSAMVKDLSASPADLAVSLSAPVTAATGSTFHWTVTVTNNGPNQAQGINLNSTIGDSILVQSVKASQGACAGGNEVSCNLGSLANGSTATVTVTAVPGTAGTVQSTASVSSVSYDPTSTNNQATASTTVTGGLYSATPVLSAISPALVEANSGSFTLTVTGSGFNSSSAVQIDGVAEPTTWVSATSLTAAIPASAIVNYGWAAVTVSNPSPGGGNSQIAPLTIYALVNLPANGIAYDSFTQKIYATLPSTATGIMGNSVIALDPVTAKVGPPVLVGSEPDIMAETSDGEYLYIGLSGADSLARFNLATQSLDATIPLSMNQYGSATNLAAGWMTVMPGTDSTLAIATAQNGSLGILDIAGNTGVFRANLGSGSNPVFLDAGHLDVFGYGLFEYAVNADGLTPISTGVGASLSGFGGLGSQGSVLANGLLYGIGGGIANPLTTPPSQVADLNINQLYGLAVAPDPANETDFLVLENAAGTFWYDLCRYDTTRYIADSVLTLPAPQNGEELGYEILRWGQDGLALRSYGSFGNAATTQILLLRGPFVLPSELVSNPTPQLATSSVSRLTSHQGNTLLTLRGSGFMPGAVALWNGSPRTTRLLSATELSVSIPAGDLASAGSVTLTVENPNSPPSSPLGISIE